MMEGDPSEVCVTWADFEKSLIFNSYFNENDNNNHHDSSSSQYRAFSDALHTELNRKYDLGPRDNVNITKNKSGSTRKKHKIKTRGKKSQPLYKNLIHRL